jgi:ubiquinone/menaquinone biosynthesis C-methylase UbiE
VKRLLDEDLNTPGHFDGIWARPEHRWDAVRMRAFTDYVQPGTRVLDLGCGLFGWAEYLALHTQTSAAVFALDFSGYACRELRRRASQVTVVQANALNAPFADASFDLVGAGEIIEHMESPAELMAEIARLTRPGGMMIVGTVDPHCEDAGKMVYPEHLWEITPQDLADMMEPWGAALYRRVGNYDFVYGTRT